ncbi:MAG: hypothetical protein OEM01_06925 [Desulfobulbaceae bacterium]|nr:hypothetical protein [Desulfobulbaceae bacterium]
MKNILGSLTLVTVLLFAVSAIAVDKVVVIPLNSSDPGPHYYTLPGAVFVGDNSAGHNTDGTIGNVGAGNYYFAPVILPNQAKLTEFVVWAKNSSTSVPDDVSLMRYDRAAAAPTVMATATVPCWGGGICTGDGTFQKLVAPSITPDVIDNIDYSYAVVIHSGDGLLQVSAIRIAYTTK